MADESILARIAAGDGAAVQECIDCYGNLVWSIARRFTRDAAEAEDAVQDVFIDLWKSASRFDPSRSAESTFVAMVARRRLIDLVRRSERRPQTMPLPEEFDIAGHDHRAIEAGVDAERAARALERIKPEQRRVLLLSVYHGLTHAEIVAQTGIPLGTVKSHIRRGLGEVRRILGETDSPGERQVPS